MVCHQPSLLQSKGSSQRRELSLAHCSFSMVCVIVFLKECQILKSHKSLTAEHHLIFFKENVQLLYLYYIRKQELWIFKYRLTKKVKLQRFLKPRHFEEAFLHPIAETGVHNPADSTFIFVANDTGWVSGDCQNHLSEGADKCRDETLQ